MDSPERRSKGVNDATTEAIGVPAAAFGTPQGFEDLYRNTFPRVYAYVASLLRDKAAAEDVTALAFERAYRKRGRFSARRGSPEAWVFGIARNAALDELRGRKRRATLAAEPADVWAPGPEEEAERAFRRDEVRVALAVRDDAPLPDADFALRMNARVSARFPHHSSRASRIRALLTTRPRLTALGAVASVFVAILVAVSLGNGGTRPAGIPSAPTESNSGSSSSASTAAQAAP